MEAQEFRAYGKNAIDYIADYLETIRDRPVLPSVQPGYLQDVIPTEAPQDPESWENIMKDMEKLILPGMTHWQSPRFHAYYPAGHSFPSILGELFSAGLGAFGFTWMTNPVLTELEVVVMDWLGKLIGLPEIFLNSCNSAGGGIIQGSASETVLVCLLAAKDRMLRKVLKDHPDWEEDAIKQKMVAYTSDQSNSSVEKAGRLGSVKIRLLPVDINCRLRKETLAKAISKDIEDGLIPTFVCATLGTTVTCAFDRLSELCGICEQHEIWLHVDAAYAGAAFVCPEYRHLMNGVDKADSFNMNAHKWLNVNFDCSAFWIKNSSWLVDAFNVDRSYLKHHKHEVSAAPDYRNWEISLGRRFRALKLWFTLRSYGVKGLQKYIRHHIFLAKEFEKKVRSDPKFEIAFESSMGLVCFRMKGSNSFTERLLKRLNNRKKIYVIEGVVQDTLFIRFAIGSRMCELDDIEFAWNEIETQAAFVLEETEDDDLVIAADEKPINGHAIKIHSFIANNLESLMRKSKCDEILLRVEESELFLCH